ncbi:hypothetical protein RF11_05806 [Thelohanellus kitauei]|uniref:Uncharacterized protein n=1 Tax=Thelohanellus kitauei TaxID=669202 RepID=A0A0C2M9U7_THEKT|nr:hypothetical protein RF11_05806 [Thelohanellus kitauei]
MVKKLVLLTFCIFITDIYCRKVVESYIYHGKIIKKEKEVPDYVNAYSTRRDVLQVQQPVQCAIGCPESCAPACKPSCCFPQYFVAQESTGSNLISPGHKAAGRCSPTCALFWTQNILDSLSGLFQSVPCPSICSQSSCCQPTSEYVTLATSCPSKCAPTYQEGCCRSSISAPVKVQPLPQPIEQKPIEPKPAVVQPVANTPETENVRYIPCSAFCAPKFTQECCEKSTVLAPIRV